MNKNVQFKNGHNLLHNKKINKSLRDALDNIFLPIYLIKGQFTLILEITDYNFPCCTFVRRRQQMPV